MKVRRVSKIPVLGRRVPPGAIRDMDNEPWGTTRAQLDTWTARRLIAGMSPKAAAVAGGMSVRSAYRWKKALVELRIVELGGMEATFAIRRGGPPARISEWTVVDAEPIVAAETPYAAMSAGVN